MIIKHDELQAVEVETGSNPVGTVVWLHGRGADGHAFEPIVAQLVRPGDRALRFIFPHAPVRPITLYGGDRMRAWHDVLNADRRIAQDESGVRASDAAIRTLVGREIDRGVASERIVLAGFSQGAAMALFSGARFPGRLAGMVGLSSYLLLSSSFPTERQPANQATPVLLAHGALDPVIAESLGEDARDALEAAGYHVEWLSYPTMGHEVTAEEIAAVACFLKEVL